MRKRRGRKRGARDTEIRSTYHFISFKDVHPSPTAGKKSQGRDLPAWGGSDGLESEYICCVHCGFENNTKDTSDGSGYGNITYDSEGFATVNGGCGFCGSSNWRGDARYG